MKKIITIILMLGVMPLLAEKVKQDVKQQEIKVQNETKNAGVEKQLQMMEQTMNKNGVEKEVIAEAKKVCLELCNSGVTPEEARKTVMSTVMENVRDLG